MIIGFGPRAPTSLENAVTNDDDDGDAVEDAVVNFVHKVVISRATG